MKLIDAEAYKSYIRKTYCQYCDGCFDEWRHDDCWQWYAIRTLEEMPTIEAKPVVHAHWIEQECEDLDTCYTCSNCKEDWVTLEGTPSDNLWKYCPACGALMDEKENENG